MIKRDADKKLKRQYLFLGKIKVTVDAIIQEEIEKCP
jgi:hypothetical protein